ncbi:MAG: Ppx/GppA phosphatase family protein [Bacteroidia bacterium]|nr:Ppx/GppA family phosphatase [Bacteroidia bacterium]MDW8159431.1 Ppx/GppA phosphatase family protein [Bacteroidia bacterium]
MAAETIAVIDLGTNTFHLLIVEIDEKGSFYITEKYKEAVKLGEGGMEKNEILPPAFERGMRAMENFRKIIDSRGAQKVFAYATAAIRGAKNSEAFIKQAWQLANIPIKVINGYEEASLIYQGIRYGLTLPAQEDVLIVDIGGGSVELIVANRVCAKYLQSIEVGAARALEFIQPDDPITQEQIQSTIQYFREALKQTLEQLKTFQLATLIGSSGTFETLGAMIAHQRGDRHLVDTLNGFIFDRKQFLEAHDKILAKSRDERLALPGMDPNRVDMILTGVILVNLLLQELNINQIMVSTYALKEGILVNYMETQRLLQPLELYEQNFREKAILQLAEKYNYAREHARLVSKIATQIFDQTYALHHYGAHERELLQYAALLLDIGHFINRSGHHKHSQYIVQNSNIPGFTANEILLLSNLVRYHRKSLPSLEHMHYNLLYREHKELVKKLAGILRIATNLDRAHRLAVEDVRVNIQNNKTIILMVKSSKNVDLEMSAALEARELFEIAFNCKLEIKQAK